MTNRFPITDGGIVNGVTVITAGGLLVDREGRLLFGLRAAWKTVFPLCWDAIGGRVEPGETVEQALVREMGEEIGVTVTGFVRLAVVEENRLSRQAQHHVFAVHEWAGTPWNACDEHSELRWFSPDELDRLPDLALADYPNLARSAIVSASARRRSSTATR